MKTLKRMKIELAIIYTIIFVSAFLITFLPLAADLHLKKEIFNINYFISLILIFIGFSLYGFIYNIFRKTTLLALTIIIIFFGNIISSNIEVYKTIINSF